MPRRLRRVEGGLRWLALGALAGPLAMPPRAHPFDNRFTGHQLEVALEPGHVRLAYVVEVPTEQALRDFARFVEGVERPGPAEQAAYTERTLRELADGLTLRVDGEPVAPTSLPVDEASGVGDHRFIVYRLQLEAPLPDGARTVHVVNANLPGDRALFFDQVWVDDALVVDASDLVEAKAGAVSRDRAAQWRGDEDLREVRVAFRARGPVGAWARRAARSLLADGAVGRLVGIREALALPAEHPVAAADAPSVAAVVAVGAVEGLAALLALLGAPVVLGAAARTARQLPLAGAMSVALIGAPLLGLLGAVEHGRAGWIGLGAALVGLAAVLPGFAVGRWLGDRARWPVLAAAGALAVAGMLAGM